MHARQVEHPVGRRAAARAAAAPGPRARTASTRSRAPRRARRAHSSIDLADREHLFVADVEDRPRAALGMFDREQRPRPRSSRCSRGGAASGRRRRRRCAAGRRGCGARSTTRAAPAGTGRRGTDSGSARRSDAPRTRPPRCGRCGSPSRRPRDRRPSGASSATGTGSPAGSCSHGVRPPAVRGHAADRHEVTAVARPSRAATMRSRPYIATTTSQVVVAPARRETTPRRTGRRGCARARAASPVARARRGAGS